MKDAKDLLQKARQDWVSDEIQKLGLAFPVAEISKKTGYADSLVSVYLSNKRAISEKFMRSFCEAYGLDFEGENQKIVDSVKAAISNDQNHPPGINKNPVNGLSSQLTQSSNMDQKLLEILERVTRTNEQHALNYAEMIGLLKRDSNPKLKAS